MNLHDFTIAFGSYDKSVENYHLPDDNPLKAALFMALKLGKPLLVTGEPGTGKTQLAYWAAWHLHNRSDSNLTPFLSRPFEFHTKTASAGKDLFYHYDAISHFQDKEGKKDVSEFIYLSAMGQAISQTMGRRGLLSKYKLQGLKNLEVLGDEPSSSVLLIDEIDKAPREFANDLLDEIENNKFTIKEMNTTIYRSLDKKTRVLVILTSNNESLLPEAFLRRCLYFNISFPTDAELMEIIIKRIGPFLEETSHHAALDFRSAYEQVIRVFRQIRERSNIKKPSTSELLDWIKVLHMEDLIYADLQNGNLDDKQKRSLQLSLYTLLKNEQDLEAIKGFLKA
jgi:MoxR-like ATPase